MHQSEDMHTLHGTTRSMEPDETRRILTPPGTWTELPYLEHQHQSEVLVAPVVVLKKKFKKKTTSPSLNVPSTIGRGQ